MYLKNDDILIREFIENDIEKKIEWINNSENNTYLHYDLPLIYDKTLNWFKNKNKVNRLDCVIEVTGVPVGLIGLLAIDHVNKKAEFYITIGNSSYKRKGIAFKSTKMLLEYAFTTLEMNKIYLNVDLKNISACSLYEKIGFKCEGIFRKDLWYHNEFIDRKRYAILNSEFQN